MVLLLRSMEFVALRNAVISYGIICVVLWASGVRSDISKTITVDHKGGGDFTTVQAAIDSVPGNNTQWIRIHVKAGTYNEKVTIPAGKPFVLLEGEGRDQTVIVWGDHASQEAPPNTPTEASATFSVLATDFVAKYISFKNSFTPVGTATSQAVAATVGADRSAFYGCGFYGFQDTLNDYVGRHFYSSCYIEGIVDFIFGFGQSLYQGCEIVVKPYTTFQVNGSITAQGRDSATDTGGFVFDRCSIGGSGQVLLGRAWRSHSRVIFSNTSMSAVVLPQGWDAWNQPTNQVFYAENACTGPGSDTTKRVKWEAKPTPDQIKEFVSMDFIDKDKWIDNQPH